MIIRGMGGSRATEAVAAEIRRELFDRGLTQAQLADELGVSPATLNKIVRGGFPGRFAAHKVVSRYGFRPSEVWPDEIEGANGEAA